MEKENKNNEIIETVDEILTEQDQPSDDNGTKQSKMRVVITSILIGVIIVVSFLSIYFVLDSVAGKGAATLYDNYTNALEDKIKNIRDEVNKSIAEFVEKMYHVESNVTISIGTLSKITNLEVLRVRESTVVYNEPDNAILDIVSWLEVTETCEYVVDLSQADFIVDNARHIVTARIPKPELANFALNDIKPLLVYSMVSTQPDGAELKEEQRKAADEEIRRSITRNQDYYNSAKSAAVTMVTNAIKALNEDIEDIQVFVEFIE